MKRINKILLVVIMNICVDELRTLELVVERLGAVSLLRDVARGW